jgi:uncharacterized protein DUF6998
VKPTSGIELDALGAGRLLLLWGEVMRALQQAGVIRSENNPVGDICEYLVAQHYGVKLAGGSNIGYDLVTPDGQRVQVKGRRRTGARWPPNFGGIGGLDESKPGFDVLVGVVLNADFTVLGKARHREEPAAASPSAKASSTKATAGSSQ